MALSGPASKASCRHTLTVRNMSFKKKRKEKGLLKYWTCILTCCRRCGLTSPRYHIPSQVLYPQGSLYRSMAHSVTFELLSTLVLRVLSTVTSAAVETTLGRTLLGRGKRTLATSLSHNNRLIIVFVCYKSDTTDCMSLSCFEHLNYLPPTPPPHSAATAAAVI